MRRRTSRKLAMAQWMCICLMISALAMPDASVWQRVVLLLAAAAVDCVWIICEARVDRAAAPLNLPTKADD